MRVSKFETTSDRYEETDLFSKKHKHDIRKKSFRLPQIKKKKASYNISFENEVE